MIEVIMGNFLWLFVRINVSKSIAQFLCDS